VSQRVPDSNRSELQTQRFPLKDRNRPDVRQNGADDRFLFSLIANITYLSHVSVFAVFLALLAVDKQSKYVTSNHVFSTQGIIIDNSTKNTTHWKITRNTFMWYHPTIESGR